MRASSCVIAAIALFACGPSSTPPDDTYDDGGVKPGRDSSVGGRADASSSGKGVEVTGTVWAPGNAPGLVAAGFEIPVAGAVVYIAPEKPPELDDGAACRPCQDAPGGAALTDAKGNFTLESVPTGDGYLVLEKAQFRSVQPITIDGKEKVVALDAKDTTLPSKHDPAKGTWLPRIALVVTASDRIEDVFAKMGMLQADASGRTQESSFNASSRIDLYTSEPEETDPSNPDLGTVPYQSKHKGSLDSLFGNLAKMKQYHLIMVPCAYNKTASTAISNPAVRKNISDYVASGGRLYTTDWSAEWGDAVFPDFVEMEVNTDNTPVNVAANAIVPVEGDSGHFAMHAKAEDPQLREWLDGQKGHIVEATMSSEFRGNHVANKVIDADDFVIEGVWTMIKALRTVRIGTDSMGKPVEATPKVWVSGDGGALGGPRTPHTVTYEPSCGRVMYSTYHTSDLPHVGMVPQERVLMYLLMEIGVCFDLPDVD